MHDRNLAEYINMKGDEIMGHISRNIIQQLHKDDLNMNQYGILRILDSDGEITMGQLAEYIQVTAPAVTILVDKLERAKYARRYRNGKDRRIIKVRLTPRGKKMLTRIRNTRMKLIKFLLDRMSPSEKKNWAFLYDRISSILKENQKNN